VGRPSKGTRARVSTRIPLVLHRQISHEADRRGLTLNDWVIWALHRALLTSRRQHRRTEQPNVG
jgi:predicted HicB family RNase H-like nuclease